MSYVQIVLLVLLFLRSMKKAESADALAEPANAFAASFGANGVGLNGEFLKKLWQNKEDVISFILRMIELFSTKEQPVFGSTAESAEVSSLIEELKAE